MATQLANISRPEAQTAFSLLLLERIRRDKHPSRAHMDILQQNLPPWLYRDYLDVLLEKVAEDDHPSIPMLHRIASVIGGM